MIELRRTYMESKVMLVSMNLVLHKAESSIVTIAKVSKDQQFRMPVFIIFGQSLHAHHIAPTVVCANTIH